MSNTSLANNLTRIYNRMLQRYGPQHWWPGESRFEIILGAVLTQATTWTNASKTITNLRAADVMSPRAIRNISERTLACLIFPSVYFNDKARKIKSVAIYLGCRFRDDIDAMSSVNLDLLRKELLSVYGLGDEAADEILLYALGKPTFVVDNYTRRVFSRLGLAANNRSDSIHRSLFMEYLPADHTTYREYHALIVRHSIEVCRKHPMCRSCSLLDMCSTGLTMTSQT